jgi:hypothetical protein
MKKKAILMLSILLSATIFILDGISKIDACYNSSCFDLLINIAQALFFFPLVFIFSVITYFTPDRIFQSWWKFARIAIPLIFIPVLLINLEVHHSQHGELQGILDIPALILLYGIFSVGSLIAIFRGWRRHKNLR